MNLIFLPSLSHYNFLLNLNVNSYVDFSFHTPEKLFPIIWEVGSKINSQSYVYILPVNLHRVIQCSGFEYNEEKTYGGLF